LNILLINDIEAIPSLSNIEIIVSISLCCENICLPCHPLLVCFCFGVVFVYVIIDVIEKANITRKVLYYTNVANICLTKCTKNSNKSNQFANSMIVIINLGIHKGYLISQQGRCLWRSCCSILGLLCSVLWSTVLLSFGHCVVCRSSTYDSRLPLWILQTFLLCHSLYTTTG
jgi:hypothetical protein